MTEIVLLAVTRMQSGVCIGGIPLLEDRRRETGDRNREEATSVPDPPSPVWVRPVKPFGTLLLGDIRYADGTLMRPWDIVALSLGRARPQPPHYEDVEADFIHRRPELRGRLGEAERREFLERVADEHPEEVWRSKQRSLTIFRPAEVAAAFSYDPYSEKYEARLWWPGCGNPEGLPVTDLKWRALGRRLTAEGPAEQRLDEKELRRLLGYESLYLAAGLSRSFEGEHWPLVVAVHTLPDYEATIDERHL